MAERDAERMDAEKAVRRTKPSLDLRKQKKAVARPEGDHAGQHSQTAGTILGLQQTHGNAYVQRLLNSGALQAKLTVNPPDDQYEREADRVAEKVAKAANLQRRSNRGEAQETIQSKLQKQPEEEKKAQTRIQRQEEQEEEKAQTKIQRQSEGEEEEEEIQTKPAAGAVPEVSESLERRISSARGTGQTLPDSIRSSIEPALGHDFSQVRVHANAEADGLSRQLGAKAFTTGQDVFFREGHYQPDTEEGRGLIGHELTHVVQQRAAPVSARAAEAEAQAQTKPKEAKVKKAPKKNVWKIVHGRNFKESIDEVKLNTDLKAKAEKLCRSLIKKGLVKGDIRFNQGVRSAKTAHAWHTAWMIRHDKVPMKNLKSLVGGMDKDQNIWWKAEWNDLKAAEAKAKAKVHAATVWPGAYAAEGYPKGDEHRSPCSCERGTTKHMSGEAMDISIPWIIDPWSEEAKSRVEAAGLKRPVEPKEPWHFELK